MRVQDINLKRTLCVLAALLVWMLACKGCDRTPVGEEHEEWIGTWSAADSEVTIKPDGVCDFEWSEGNHTNSVSGGAARWEDDTFYCALLFDSDFPIDQAPTQEGDTWTMTLDGQQFQKIE